jgi:hypothetical protein
MLLLCFAGLGFMSYRRKNKLALNVAYNTHPLWL